MGRRGGREGKKRRRVEKRDSVEETKEQAYQPGINKIPRAIECKGCYSQPSRAPLLPPNYRRSRRAVVLRHVRPDSLWSLRDREITSFAVVKTREIYQKNWILSWRKQASLQWCSRNDVSYYWIRTANPLSYRFMKSSDSSLTYSMLIYYK